MRTARAAYILAEPAAMADHAAYESFLAVRDDNTLRARVLPCGARGLAACPAASFAGGGFPVDRFWYNPALINAGGSRGR